MLNVIIATMQCKLEEKRRNHKKSIIIDLAKMCMHTITCRLTDTWKEQDVQKEVASKKNCNH